MRKEGSANAGREKRAGNDRLLRALRRREVDTTPVWFMRQAGRYLPEYRATRGRAGTFLDLAMTPELACEVTLQPVTRYAFDAAIIFSDILTIPHAMGLGLEFVEGEGPRFQRVVRDARAVEALPDPDPETDLGYVMEAIRLVRSELGGRVPLIGFAGSPWTLACYMVEGRSGTDFRTAKQMAHEAPALMHALLGKLAVATVRYLSAQIAAGAEVVMLFDTWGGVLSPRDYETFSLRYARQVFAGLGSPPAEAASEEWRVPIILFSKGAAASLASMAESGCDAVGLDWTVGLGQARVEVGSRVALQGNLDPCILRASPERIRAEVGAVLEDYGPGPGHVFNLGHGITPDIDPERVGVVVDAVHELGRAHHDSPVRSQGISRDGADGR